MSLIVSIFLGIALSAAAGFRVFVPLLAASLAARFELWELSDSFQWIGSTPALIAFASAAILEIAGYFIPFVDNLLDSIAAPLAVVAGTGLMVAVVGDMDPFFKWVLAIIAGGGTAAAIKGTTATARAGSSVVTAGVANPAIALAETGSSLAMSVLSLVLPVLAGILGLLIATFLIYRWRRWLRKRRVIPPETSS